MTEQQRIRAADKRRIERGAGESAFAEHIDAPRPERCVGHLVGGAECDAQRAERAALQHRAWPDAVR
jgi:hypothetical protein